MSKLTVDEAKQVIEKAKHDLPAWEVVLNVTYSDEVVREGVLFNLLKMFYQAARSDADIMRLPEESFEAAIGRVALMFTDGAWWPSRAEIDDVVEAAFAFRGNS